MEESNANRAPFTERFLHVDMDAFYVEVERLRDASLAGVPVIVGGLGRRGVVASASYEARELGVRSAMPISEARRRCPRGRYLPPDHRRYADVSGEVFNVLRSFTPYVEALSVDEAFLDVSGLRLHFGDSAAVGEAIRTELAAALGLPASVGIAATKFLAKLASEDAKPDGLLVVPAGEELAFLHPLPVGRLWGVGAATHAALEGLAVETVGDLAALDPQALARRLGPSVGAHLASLAAGNDPREVEVERDTKSISVEETYAVDLADGDAVDAALLELATRLAGRLYKAAMTAKTVALKLRFGDFTTVNRSVSAKAPLGSATELWDAARVLLGRVDVADRGVRLLGLAASHLEEHTGPEQLAIGHDRRSDASDVAEQVRARFGSEAVISARLVRKSSDRGETRPNS